MERERGARGLISSRSFLQAFSAQEARWAGRRRRALVAGRARAGPLRAAEARRATSVERGGGGARRLRAEPIGILPPGIFRRWGAWARTEGRVRAPGVWMCRTGMRASSRRPHGRQLARMRAGGRPARHIWPAPGRPRRQRPLRCIVAAPGARLCPNFRGRQCASLSCCSSWGGTGRATGRVCDLPGYCRMWFDFCGLGRFSPPAHCSAGWWEPRFHTADALALFMLSCPHRHGWGSYLAHVRLEYIDATLAT